jgi:SAM-dependent methyltransferase
MFLQKRTLIEWLGLVSRKLATHPVVKRIYPNWALQQSQSLWNQRWANPNFSNTWVLTAPPQEIQDAVQSRWFPPRAKVLDIGCGSGELSVWLASQGFEVVGIDFTEHAIRKAKIKHQINLENLAWQVIDICRQTPGLAPFDVLIDRGCLHGIPKDFVSRYVKHTAACSISGTRFMLFHKTVPISSNALIIEAEARRVAELIETHFQPIFEILEISPTILHRSTGDKLKEDMSGLVIRMMKR